MMSASFRHTHKLSFSAIPLLLLLIYFTSFNSMQALAFALPKPPVINVSINVSNSRHHKQYHKEISPLTSHPPSTSTTLNSIPLALRGGASTVAPLTPTSLFNKSLLVLGLLSVFTKLVGRPISTIPSPQPSSSPPLHNALRLKFLPLFYILRLSDWLQGPYFYSVYATKTLADGTSYPLGLISKLFLTGFASTAIAGPWLGRVADTSGRKKATLLFTLLYTLGALSTRSDILAYLFLGRVLSGLGTSLLFSAPESWLVSESQNIPDEDGRGGKELSKTFGLAYAGDSIVAILAGQLASLAARKRGETGPFELSAGVLALGAMGVATVWKENKAERKEGKGDSNGGIREGVKMVMSDPKIFLTGLIQAAFEGAMYTFVINWPPSLSSAVTSFFGPGAATPYGSVFSCFMACCLVGSTLFQRIAKYGVENVGVGMLLTAAASMTIAAFSSALPFSQLKTLVMAFFMFEACVGVYFPFIGTLRSKTVPDSHRSVIMNIFGIPLNALVVAVFLGIKKLGVDGALKVSAASLCVASAAAIRLRGIMKKEA
eukprot:CAMPEP_0118667398 /NCGR_PEP_ID=MMETSP0785-20121206/19766_1 /TAXON_ID=91992 /ORGANISM="Bolidomonas pacifica, Strain CCMP 1866" /LENGTH=545 /DNA_ID=CAMNT_0006561851 /DNA_START=104 /DNA_END=1737 /DNA_ORIENTATION=+